MEAASVEVSIKTDVYAAKQSGFGNEYEYRAIFMIIPPPQDLFTLIIAKQKLNHSQTFPIHQT